MEPASLAIPLRKMRLGALTASYPSGFLEIMKVLGEGSRRGIFFKKSLPGYSFT